MAHNMLAPLEACGLRDHHHAPSLRVVFDGLIELRRWASIKLTLAKLHMFNGIASSWLI